MQAQRRRERDPEIHVSNNLLMRFAHIENREHVHVGPEVDDRQMLKRLADDKKHTVTVGPVDDDYDDHDDSVCLPLRSVFPISFDCLYSQDSISKDVVGTADEAEGNIVCLGTGSDDSHIEGSQDVGSSDGHSVGCFEGPDLTLVAYHLHPRYDNNRL